MNESTLGLLLIWIELWYGFTQATIDGDGDAFYMHVCQPYSSRTTPSLFKVTAV